MKVELMKVSETFVSIISKRISIYAWETDNSTSMP